MKLSMEQAAIVIGKSKKTIYNHKDKNKFSYDIDEEGKAVIDASEILRVYGNKPEITERLKELQEPTKEQGSVNTQNYTKKASVTVKDSEIVEYRIKIAQLEAELDKEKSLKIKTEEDLEYFKEALIKSQETAQKVTLLLEDKRDKPDHKTDNWEKSLKALEERITNQEKDARIKSEAKEKEKEELQKQLEEKENLLKEKEEALDLEKHKSFIHRMLGK